MSSVYVQSQLLNRALSLLTPVVLTSCTAGCLSLPESEGRLSRDASPTSDAAVVVAAPLGFAPEDAQEYAFELTAEILRTSLFEIDRLDRAGGQVITRPLPAQSFPEFWRRDSVGVVNWAEAAIHRLRRTVIAQVRPEPDGRYAVSFRAITERFANPDRPRVTPSDQLNSALLLQQGLLNDRVAAESIVNVNEPEGGFWVDLGRDRQLERKLAVRLERLALQRAAQEEAILQPRTPVAPLRPAELAPPMVPADSAKPVPASP